METPPINTASADTDRTSLDRRLRVVQLLLAAGAAMFGALHFKSGNRDDVINPLTSLRFFTAFAVVLLHSGSSSFATVRSSFDRSLRTS